MKLASSVLLVALVGCASEDSGGGGNNPPTLWLAEGSGSVMTLVAAEPKPY